MALRHWRTSWLGPRPRICRRFYIPERTATSLLGPHARGGEAGHENWPEPALPLCGFAGSSRACRSRVPGGADTVVDTNRRPADSFRRGPISGPRGLGRPPIRFAVPGREPGSSGFAGGRGFATVVRSFPFDGDCRIAFCSGPGSTQRGLRMSMKSTQISRGQGGGVCFGPAAISAGVIPVLHHRGGSRGPRLAAGPVALLKGKAVPPFSGRSPFAHGKACDRCRPRAIHGRGWPEAIVGIGHGP